MKGSCVNFNTMGKRDSFPVRQSLPHSVPDWVPEGAVFFLTVCTRDRNRAVLTSGQVPEILIEGIRYHHDRWAWYCHLFLVMPDHVHGLFSFPPETNMNRLVTNWKSYTARLGGFRWQGDFFDHRLRSDESFDEKAAYIRRNPVRAGYVETHKEWRHWWVPETAR